MDIPIIGGIFEWLEDMSSRGFDEGWHWLILALLALFVGFLIWKVITKMF